MSKRVETLSSLRVGVEGTGYAPPQLEVGRGGEEHRRFPRAKVEVPVAVWIDVGGDRRFSATLPASNLSVSGVFLDSTFFLPVGTELSVRFPLHPAEPPVEARAQIVREERPDRGGQGRSGFALRFLEFYGQSEVTLAKLFLGQQLTEFAEGYLGSARAKALRSEQERVIDALAAWELLRATTPGSPWGLKQEG